MGAPMAQHLLAAGYPLKIWNRTPEKTRSLAACGGTIVARCADALDQVDVAICMLSTGPVIDQVLFGPDSTGTVPVDQLKYGAVLIVMSSIPVETARRQAQHLAGKSVQYVDAPVSGGEMGAKAAKLTIMAGGDVDVISRVCPILECMGSPTHVGPVGMGELAKLVNQMIVGITIGAVAEALLLANRAGADVSAVRTALCGGFADSTVLRQHGQRMQEGNYTPGAPAVTQLKDLKTAQDFAETLNLDLPFVSLVTSLYQEMCDTDLRQLDHSALYVYLARRAEKSRQ